MAQAMERNELSDAQRERLGVIRSSGEALLQLLDDLLDLSKIEGGEVELETGIVDTQELADNARGVFAPIADRKGLSLGVAVTPASAGRWVGDPRRIRQVLHNLIANAIKFTDHGSIRVDIDNIDGALELKVRDTGLGIPAAMADQVFDKFVQVDASATRRFGGSGLGLTVCRNLVSLMKGHIRLQSSEGEGSTFTVKLPLPRSGALPPEPGARLPSHASPLGLRVMAAEDNETNQRVLKALLGSAEIEPFMVANGRDAVDAWKAAPWDLVLMDIQMPVLDGVTATKQMREIERREGRTRAPIIALTAKAMAHHEAEYLAAGMDAVVGKPINLVKLIEAMDAALGPAEAP